jgi:hypothetical protein
MLALALCAVMLVAGQQSLLKRPEVIEAALDRPQRVVGSLTSDPRFRLANHHVYFCCSNLVFAAFLFVQVRRQKTNDVVVTEFSRAM